MTLEEKYKKLLELVEKYDKFAVELKNDYFCEIGNRCEFRNWVSQIIKETNHELFVLREELRSIKNE